MFSKKERSTFPYWFAHTCAYQMTALNCGVWKFKYLFHDIEKPFLKLLLPYSKVQRIHRIHHRHHPEWLENKLKYYDNEICYEPDTLKKLLDKFDYDGAIIDWECCHFTKAEEPLDAYGEYKKIFKDFRTFQEKYPLIAKHCYYEFSERLLESIKKLGLYGKGKSI